jgi:uncharacterized protein YlxP (DUF503 family)
MAATVGVARVTIFLAESSSLKEKRRVVRSLTQRISNQFNAGVAEIEDLDDQRVATLGIVCVSNSAPHADEMLATIVKFIERNTQIDSVGEIETELIPI